MADHKAPDQRDAISSAADEITLCDIWRALVRYKYLFWAVVLCTFLTGIIAAYLYKPSYKFSQILRVGGAIYAGNIWPLQNPEQVKKTLNIYVIPNVLNKYAKQNPHITVPRVTVGEDAAGSLIALNSQGQLGAQKQIEHIFKDILQALNEEELPIILAKRSYIQQQLNTINQQINLLNKFLNKDVKPEKNQFYPEQVNHETRANDLAFLFDERQGYQLVSAKLLAQTKLSDLQNQIDLYQQELKSIKPSQFADELISSSAPVNLSVKQILIMALIFGFLLGLIAVLLIDLIKKNKHYS